MLSADNPVILMIEDSPTQAQAISTYLSVYAVDVVIATTGEQALRLIRAQMPDVIVLDINLPGMDGYQVCNRIKRNPDTEHIPIIILTSEEEAAAKLKSEQLGALKFMHKDDLAMDTLVDTLIECDIILEKLDSYPHRPLPSI